MKCTKSRLMFREEKKFFYACYIGKENGYGIVEISHFCAEYIPLATQKRYLEKWAKLGFYKYKTGLFFGWFDVHKMPAHYVDVLLDKTVIKDSLEELRI